MWQATLLSLWGSSLPHVAEATSCESDISDLIQISREKDVKYEAPDMSMWESEAANLLETLALVDISFTCPASNLKVLEEEVLKRSDPKNPLYWQVVEQRRCEEVLPSYRCGQGSAMVGKPGLEEATLFRRKQEHFFQEEGRDSTPKT